VVLVGSTGSRWVRASDAAAFTRNRPTATDEKKKKHLLYFGSGWRSFGKSLELLPPDVIFES